MENIIELEQPKVTIGWNNLCKNFTIVEMATYLGCIIWRHFIGHFFNVIGYKSAFKRSRNEASDNFFHRNGEFFLRKLYSNDVTS